MFKLWRKSVGDFVSVCDAKPENAELSELNWNGKNYVFYFINDEGLFSQRNDSENAYLLISGNIEDYRVLKTLGKIIFVEDGKLWVTDMEGSNKTELIAFPTEKEPYIEGLSADEKTLLVILQNKDRSVEVTSAERDLIILDTVSQKTTSQRGLPFELVEKYGIQRLRHENKSLSPNGQNNIELKEGKFVVNNQELFYCGTVKGTLQASGPACYKHNWLDDNNHIVVDLCGTVIVEKSTSKVVRLNNGRQIDW